MPIAAIHQPECFPWLGLLDKAARCDVFILLDDVQFEKNYFQNRNKIRTAEGWSWLSVPVATTGRSKQAINEVEISPVAVPRWREKHLASWKQNYGPSAFGPRYLPFIEGLYSKSWTRLVDFNREVIAWLFTQFEIKAKVVPASSLASKDGSVSERLANLCAAAGAREYLSGISGKEYMDEAPFKANGVAVRYQEFRHPVYPQRFEPFVPAMTSLDLLFSQGPASAALLKDAKSPRLDTVFL